MPIIAPKSKGDSLSKKERTFGTAYIQKLSDETMDKPIAVNKLKEFSDWESGAEYTLNSFVFYDNNLYRCITAHTSETEFDSEKFVKVTKGGEVEDWEAGKKYFKDNLVFKDNVLYRCTVEHTSSSFDAELTDGYWIKVSGGSSGGGSGTSNYSQFAIMNVTAPKTYEIKIEETTDFCFPPVEVLKFKAGDKDIVVDALTFDLSDGKMFEVDGVLSDESPFALYKDGKLYLNTDYTYKYGTATICGNGYTTISEDIDLGVFKNVDSVEVL